AEARRVEAAAPPPPAPERLPESEPGPVPTAPAPALLQRRAGVWNLNDLERLVAARRDEEPDRAAEWSAYVFFLREHAGVDGRLPSSFDSLVEEVFADLVQAG